MNLPIFLLDEKGFTLARDVVKVYACHGHIFAEGGLTKMKTLKSGVVHSTWAYIEALDVKVPVSMSSIGKEVKMGKYIAMDWGKLPIATVSMATERV